MNKQEKSNCFFLKCPFSYFGNLRKSSSHSGNAARDDCQIPPSSATQAALKQPPVRETRFGVRCLSRAFNVLPEKNHFSHSGKGSRIESVEIDTARYTCSRLKPHRVASCFHSLSMNQASNNAAQRIIDRKRH